VRRESAALRDHDPANVGSGSGAKAVGVGRYYLYPLAAAGQAGVERALGLMQTELERDMKLMGCTAISQLSRDNLRFR
jgi:L-lactate dehydrogenase (cytochrome)